MIEMFLGNDLAEIDATEVLVFVDDVVHLIHDGFDSVTTCGLDLLKTGSTRADVEVAWSNIQMLEDVFITCMMCVSARHAA